MNNFSFVKKTIMGFAFSYVLSKIMDKVSNNEVDLNKYFSKSMEFEGGFTNDANDPGGATKYGICRKYYPELTYDDVYNLSKKQAFYYYKRDYWDRYSCAKVSKHVQFLFFDTVLHQGGDFATRMMQRITGATIDGILGDETATLSKVVNLDEFAQERKNRCLERIKENSDLNEFLGGWYNRINKALAFQKEINR